jgi:sulfite exporter TauE/SafE
MAGCGLGTLPTLFGIGLSGRMLPGALRLKLRRAVPIGVSVLAVLLILRGAALEIPYFSPDFSLGWTNAHCHSR